MNVRRKLLLSNLDDFSFNKTSNNELNISWDSSPESKCNVAKKFKSDDQLPTKCTKWINVMDYQTESSSHLDVSNSDYEFESNLINNSSISVNICSQYTEKVCSPDIRPSQSSHCDLSPIIGRFIVNELSPVLRCESPIIGRNRKRRLGKVKKKLISQETPALSEYRTHPNDISLESTLSKSSYVIESASEDCDKSILENNTPTCRETNESLVAEVTLDQQASQYIIEPFSSQECNLISSSLISYNSTSSDSNQQQNSTKRKNYKKFGLADQLQKALKKQENELAIFRHELYLGKLKHCVDNDSVLYLKIVKFWKEFQLRIVLCSYLNDCQASKTCLVIIGFNVKHDLNIQVNLKLKIYEPYETKVVKYEEADLNCYFNVSKIFSSK